MTDHMKNADKKAYEHKIKIAVAADIHYLSPSLMENNGLFSRLVVSNDAKTVEYGDALTDAFFHEIAQMRPDALIIAGDLSFNGEKESHLRLAKKLKPIKDAGICVLVTTGNHDISNKKAFSFSGTHVTETGSVTSGGFIDIYGDFGYGGAKSRDAASLSYTFDLCGTLIVMLDANSPACPCGVSLDTLSWLEAKLFDARRNGMRIIAVGHQNLFRHSIFDKGYVIKNAAALYELFEKYGVRLFLSGHMHIQHILTKGGVTEIATSALPVGACQYGVVTLDGDELCYTTRRADVSSWALSQKMSDKNLLSFADYARRRMDEKTALQTTKELSDKPFSSDEKRAMISYAQEANFAYFSGDLRSLEDRDPNGRLGALWERSGTFTGRYLSSVRKEAGRDHTRFAL
ncbi:MAG: metallophosphoesterase [Clostridia bacterium]|nr:metallophosphoesterase [Clostridia bacterium]